MVFVAVVKTAWTTAVVGTAWGKVMGGAALETVWLVEATAEVLVLGIVVWVEGYRLSI